MWVEATRRMKPKEQDFGLVIGVVCAKCGLQAETSISREAVTPKNGCVAFCPDKQCKGKMLRDFSQCNVTVTSRGSGVSSTKYGQRRARELTKRNEELRKKQWSNMEVKQKDGMVARNPTPGGPLDPNGPFSRKKGDSTLFIPGTAVERKGNRTKRVLTK